MAKRKMSKVKPLTKPTAVFNKKPLKPEKDDTPGRMTGGKQPGGLAHHARSKRLKGVTI